MGRGAADVDLDLEAGGSPGVDLELLGDDDAPVARGGARGSDVDLDLGQALSGTDSLADTGESPALDADSLDFAFDEDRIGTTTREIAPRRDSPTVEQPVLGGFGDSPTVESPELGARDGNTIRQKLDSALLRRTETGGDATQELSLDDLGFDVGSLDATSTSLESPDARDPAADAPTMVASLDDRSREMLREAEERATRTIPDLEKTKLAPPRFDRDELTQLAPSPGLDGATERLLLDPAETGSARVLGSDSDLDLDLDELAKALENDTIEQPRRDDAAFADVVSNVGRKGTNGTVAPAAAGTAGLDLDLDVGEAGSSDRYPTLTERMNVDDLALPELEPVTLSEVGTKLDLARAYMDMGDPDGARSILQEVLSEGSASQKQEAQRLIEALPG
ncbi:MAG: FimV/HubP family polar landmark protein [Pseudomonadota bacterium]